MYIRRTLTRSRVAILAVSFLCSCAPRDIASVETCPAFAHVDRTAPPPHLNGDPAQERLDVIWEQWAQAKPDIAWRGLAADAAIRLETSDGMAPHRARREVVGRRSSAGWEIHARSSPLDGPLLAWSPWTSVKLSDRAASRLDALLDDPCLWRAPPFLDAEVRLRNGRYDSRPDGPSTLYDVSVDKRRWGGWQVSWTVGPSGQLRGLLLSEAFGLPERALDEIGPDGWIDKP
jgi:hypothetical protein